MSFLKCKLCFGDVIICGELSILEPKTKCKKCGHCNFHEVKKEKFKVIVEYKSKK